MKKSSKLTQKSNTALKSAMFYVVPFAILSVYLLISYFVKGKPEVGGYYPIHFLYTYDHGFISRGFVGEVISWFTDTVSDELMSNLSICFFVFLMFTASLCIGKALNKASEDEEIFKMVLVLLIVISLLPMTFRNYYLDIRNDKLVWAVALLGVFFACNKKTMWLTIPICLLATLINPVFLFESMILVSMILLQEFKSSGYSKKNGIICFIAYSSMIAFGLWSVASENNLGFENAREMVDFYFSRYTGSGRINYVNFEKLWIADYFSTVYDYVDVCIYGYGLAWRGILDTILIIIFIYAPLYTITGLFWKKSMSKTDDKMQKFIFFLCMISPIVAIPHILLSWESSKMFGNNLVVQLGLLVYFIANKNDAVLKAIDDVKDFAKKNILVTAALLIYFVAVMV